MGMKVEGMSFVKDVLSKEGRKTVGGRVETINL